ncbi:MAG: ribosome silencing factor [Proteobacteria bacterium]|nr:ribosome silencing factor [Pseudomonadota bacterium]MBU1687741.1 ribosome silencing factor [Pseudomonadota bacterium]
MKKIQQKYRDMSSLEQLSVICRVALEKKAEDLVVLDVRTISDFADYFVIASGTSTRHVQGMAQAIDQEIGSKRMKSSSTEGYTDGQWILLDYSEVVVHLFYHETRTFYDLEGLWHDAPRLDPENLPVV